MIVHYSTRVNLIREANAGVCFCHNCGHNTQHGYCRLSNQAIVYSIPIFGMTTMQGILCEYCGDIYPLTKAEYKEQLTRAILLNGQL